jgi:hypothetical protein
MRLVVFGTSFLLLILAVKPAHFNARAHSLALGISVAFSRVQNSKNVWRGLVPLRATRKDIEKLLGTPKARSHPDYIYETKSESVIVRYSTKICGESSGAGWDVPVDTVITVTVSPKHTVLIRDLGLELNTFARSEIAHPRGLIRYLNLKEGVSIESKFEDNCEVVLEIVYQPNLKDAALACPFNNESQGESNFHRIHSRMKQTNALN